MIRKLICQIEDTAEPVLAIIVFLAVFIVLGISKAFLG